jgi:CrcB protein
MNWHGVVLKLLLVPDYCGLAAKAVLKYMDKDFTLVGLDGFWGALARYGVNTALEAGYLPWGTFLANVTGSLLLGFVQVLAMKGIGLGPRFRLVAGVGFCGAYTTFSTFTMEGLELLYNSQLVKAACYIFGTAACCLFSVIAGMALGNLLSTQLQKRENGQLGAKKE